MSWTDRVFGGDKIQRHWTYTEVLRPNEMPGIALTSPPPLLAAGVLALVADRLQLHTISALMTLAIATGASLEIRAPAMERSMR